ncbi:MAG: PAS domain S-box protein [Flavobacteriales bacterium]
MSVLNLNATLREVLEISPGYSLLVNSSGEILHRNTTFDKLFQEIFGNDSCISNVDDLQLVSSNFKKQFFWNDIFEFAETGRFNMNVCLGESNRVFKCTSGSFMTDGDITYLVCLHEVTPSYQMEKKMMEKNGFFESLLNELPQMICAMDENGNIRYWNEQCKSILGYDSNEIVMGHDAMLKLIPNSAYRKDIIEKIYRKESGVLRFINIKMMASDGAEKIISWSLRYMANPLVPSLNFWMVGTDITGLEVAMKSLVESEERFSIISKASNDAVWDWDLASGNLWWNEGMTALFGYPSEEIENTYDWWLERVHPSYATSVNEKLERHVKEGIPFWSDEYLFRKADGTYALVFDKGYLIMDDKDKPLRFVGGMVDITHTKNLNTL